MLGTKLEKEREARHLKETCGFLKIKARTKHPALIALAHFSNLLQTLGFPFSAQDRKIYYKGCTAVGGSRYMICPNCAKKGKFTTIAKGGKPKAWFCSCDYEDTPTDPV